MAGKVNAQGLPPTAPPLKPPARAIFMAGFMAAGKSAVGRLVAERAGLPFIDTDELVEHAAAMPIAKIFSDHGEEHFRRLESEALAAAIRRGPAVVATGGGMMTRAHNLEAMKAAGPIVLLSVTAETVIERTRGDATRPLLAAPDPLARARELLAARREAYEQADICIPADDAPPEQIAERVLSALALDPRAAALVPLPVRVEVLPGDAPPYSVLIGRGLIDAAEQWFACLVPEGARVAVVTAEGPCEAIARRLAGALADAWQVRLFAVPDSEESKSVAQLARLWDQFAAWGMDRSSWVVAVGGGMVGDLAATAAATYMRGVPIVHVPTTVLSQIDSSIGGKAAVNLAAAKNLVGAFHQPRLVLTDLAALDTLPDEQLRDGLAEGIKHAALFDPEMFRWLEHNVDGVLGREPAALKYFIARNVQLKAAVVSADPKERHLRALLNFGHTIGHALERAAEAWGLSHGKAVAVGMAVEAEAAAEMELADPRVAARLRHLLEAAGLPTGPVAADRTLAERALMADKKKAGRTLKLPVVVSIGRSAVIDGVDAGRLAVYLARAIDDR